MVWYVSALVYGVGGLVVTGIALLVAFQEKLVYVPVLPGLTKSYAFTPARLRLNYEDVWLTSSDGVRLHAWFIKLFPHCQGPTILFFQENAGNIAHRLEMMRIMLQQLQCNVFMLSYRGYGASDGFPSQHGITKDAQAALDHLCQRSDIDTSRIVVFGRSLGGAVGAVLTKNNPDKDSGTGKTIGAGIESRGLYYLIAPPSPVACSLTESPELIHSRLGHPSLSKLRHMVPFLSSLKSLNCHSCQQGKHTRSSFANRVNKRADAPFSIVHSDIWGPSQCLFWVFSILSPLLMIYLVALGFI
ncbi:alpha/beta hydrolase domain-containing protein WAV2-like isoform X3 [Gastrolobium bilobum]|uniref:alpha/beta hydrolase domain-containing protein WAV2-like isoform X3 n=1 Tax=Gastrolobium bilobum TaxID=150636 RepID=UPI002AB001E8|nr:alpha/beta hydrolase domain-containing protein WAV2-like isoform X3 [Gastrolobium bilobum]